MTAVTTILNPVLRATLVVATLAMCLGGCASSKSSRSGGADLARQEEENRRLRAELGAKNAAAEQAWAAANRAESQAQVAGASCSQISSTQGGAAARSGANHGSVTLNGTFHLRPKFSSPRSAGPVQVTSATCQVSR